jgi:hypothetical protein
VLAEQDDEWSVAERRYFSAESMKLLVRHRCCRDRRSYWPQ